MVHLQTIHQILVNMYKSTDVMFRLKYDTKCVEIHM